MSRSQAAGTMVFTWQNTLAALMFAVLLISNSLAYLLYCFPSVELLWRLNIAADRLSRPVTAIVDRLPGHSLFTSLALLGLLLTIAWIGFSRRHLLATAVTGHLALIFGAFATSPRLAHPTAVAELSFRIDPAVLTVDTVGMLMTLALMFVLCVANHILFFRRLRLH